jgi:hypothetical protein
MLKYIKIIIVMVMSLGLGSLPSYADDTNIEEAKVNESCS